MRIMSEGCCREAKKSGISKLSGWLSVSENNDNCRSKSGVDGIVWKLKAVTYCGKTKHLFISSFNGDEQEIYPDSPLKSPCLDNGLSAKSELPFGGRSTRPRLDSQSGFKQFFSRKLAISRSRSVGKMGSQKSDASSPKSPNAFWASWRSQEAESSSTSTCCDEEATESSINLSDGSLCMIRPVHPSVAFRQYCFQVLTPLDTKYFCCCSEEEYWTWLHGLNASVQYNRDEKIRLDTSLSIWIFEAKGIPMRKKYFCEILLDKMLFSRTTAKCKNDMLFWGEQFSFEDLPPTESVTISLFRESDTKKKRKPDKSVFVGSSVIDLVNLESNAEIEKWVSVHIPGISPKLQQKTTVSKSEQPSIRTKLKYETNVVLPLISYDNLFKYLNENYLILTSTLEVSISLKTKDLLAHTLLKVLLSANKAEAFLVDVIMNEVQNTTDENLTFRGNSLATKSIDTYMKMIGKNYIQQTLVSFINSVYEFEDDTEVDPQKLTHNSCLSDNQISLIKLVEDAWRSIFLSLQIFPKNLQLVFSMVRKQCELLGRDIVKKIVSASLFLRLLCPAILSPSLFLLTPEYPCEKVARTLTLVAKTIQNLANFTRFGSKEGYMEILNDFVEREMGNMDNFLQRISYEPDCTDDNECPECMNIDLARELSVIYHLLSIELAKLSPDATSKLNDLKIILDNIRLVYECSPNADEICLCQSFASVCSEPLTTPTGGEDTCATNLHETNPQLPACYLDTSLSLIEDHVSGSSPICNRSESCETGLLHSHEDMPHSHEGMLPKTTFAPPSDDIPDDDHCKCAPKDDIGIADSMLPLPPQNTNSITNIPHNEEESERSIVNRKKQSQSSYTTRKRQSSTVKDRINMFSKKTDSLTTKHESKSHSHVYSQNTKHESKSHSHAYSQNVKHTQHASPNRNTNLQTVPEKMLATRVTSPPILVPMLSDNHAKSAKKSNNNNNNNNNNDKNDNNNDNNNNEMLLPRLNSIDDDIIENSSESESSHSGEKDVYCDRAHLKLHSLQNEHYFIDEMLPCDTCCHNEFDKQTSNAIQRVTNNISHRKHAKRHAASCEPRSSVSVHVSNERFKNTSVREYGIQRRYSEMTSSEGEKQNFNRDTMVVAQSRDIAQIHSNGYCEILHEGTVEHANPITSSCSSNCSYSSESCFSDEEYGTCTKGDSLSKALHQHNHMCGASMIHSGRTQRHSDGNMLLTRTTGGEVAGEENNGYDSNDDIDIMRVKLRESELLLQKTQKELKLRSENFEQTVIRLKDKLIEADTKMKSQRAENETQMKNVISRLLNVEGELRNEHAEMEAVIKGKQKMIEIQEKRIKALEGSNIRLLRVLSNMKRNHSRQEDKDIDELLECLNNRTTPTDCDVNTNSQPPEPDEDEIKHV